MYKLLCIVMVSPIHPLDKTIPINKNIHATARRNKGGALSMDVGAKGDISSKTRILQKLRFLTFQLNHFSQNYRNIILLCNKIEK